MPDPLSAIAGAGSSILGSIFSGIFGSQAQNWYKNALTGVFNNLNQGYGFGTQYGQSQFDPSSAAAQGLLNRAPQLLFGNSDGSSPGDLTNLSQYLSSAFGGLSPDAFKQSGLTPGGQTQLDNMGGTAAGLSNPMSLLAQVIANGGGSAQGKQIWDALQGVAGGNTPAMQNLLASGTNLLQNPQNPMTNTLTQQGINSVGSGGMTPGLNFAQNAAQGMVNAGGSNSNIDSGVSRALQLLGGNSPIIQQLLGAAGGGLGSNLGVQGLTPTGAAGETAALGGIQNQGQTQDSNFFQKAGQSLTQPAVLPTLAALSAAKDTATGQMVDAAQKAREQAVLRGGGPGSVVANGATNQGLADFADQGGRAISSAVLNQLLQQQQLGLTQLGEGANMGLQGGSLQLGNLDNYSSLLTSLENAATGRYSVGGGLLGNAGGLSNQQIGQGMSGLGSLSGLQSQNILSSLGLMPGISGAAAGQAGTFGNLGLGVGNLNLSNLSEGGNLLNAFNGTSLQGLGGLQGNLNQANQYTLGASGALNNFSGTQGGLFNNILQGGLSGSQLGMNQSSNYYNALGGLLSGQQGMVNTDAGFYGPGMNTLNNIGNAGFGLANTALSGMPHVFSGYQPYSPWGSALSGVASGIPNLLGAIFQPGSGNANGGG